MCGKNQKGIYGIGSGKMSAQLEGRKLTLLCILWWLPASSDGHAVSFSCPPLELDGFNIFFKSIQFLEKKIIGIFITDRRKLVDPRNCQLVTSYQSALQSGEAGIGGVLRSVVCGIIEEESVIRRRVCRSVEGTQTQHMSLLFTGMVGLENVIDMLSVNFKGTFLDTCVIPLRQGGG